MSHPSPLAWSYIVLFGGFAIVLIAFGVAIRGKKHLREENPDSRRSMTGLAVGKSPSKNTRGTGPKF